MPDLKFLIEDDDLLERLARETGRANEADVLCDALSMYNEFARRVALGEKIFVGTDAGHIREFQVLPLEVLRVKHTH